MAAWEAWLPPDLPPEVLASLVQRCESDPRCDPHEIAAIAWEWQAAASPLEGSVQSVQTGAQSVTYAGGGSGNDPASRARWHRSRMRAKTVQVGPDHVWVRRERLGLGLDPVDEEDTGVIRTYPSPSRPPS